MRSFTQFKNLTKQQEVGRSDKATAAFNLLESVYCTAIVKRLVNHCCQPLFMLWSESGLYQGDILSKGWNILLPGLILCDEFGNFTPLLAVRIFKMLLKLFHLPCHF